MRTMLMYDTAGDVEGIPANAQAVAGYVDGAYRTFPALVRRFWPHAHCVSIGVEIGNLAAITDVEAGNPVATPSLVRQDFERKRAHGIWKPGYYANVGDMRASVIPGLTGIPRHEYRLWLADWDRLLSVPPGYDAKQLKGGVRIPFDLSIVDVDTFFPPELKKPRSSRVHPKVTAGAISGAFSTVLLALLNSHGAHVTHLSTAEIAAITTAASSIAGYLKRA